MALYFHILVSQFKCYLTPVCQPLKCDMAFIVLMHCYKPNTVLCRYNAVNFLQNLHQRHPIALGCLLWIQFLVYVLPQLLECCIAVLDCVITALDCITYLLSAISIYAVLSFGIFNISIILLYVLLSTGDICVLGKGSYWQHDLSDFESIDETSLVIKNIDLNFQQKDDSLSSKRERES